MTARCRHHIERTVMIELNLDGDVYLRTYCGPIQAVGAARGLKYTCGGAVGRPRVDFIGSEFLGSAEVGQRIETRVGKKKFLITVTEIK